MGTHFSLQKVAKGGVSTDSSQTIALIDWLDV